MRIAIVTDAWLPQVNGVVTTLLNVISELRAMGDEVQVFTLDIARRKISCPTYPEIKLAYFPFRELARALDAFHPDAVHISTEVGVGLAARRYCLKRRIPFTSAFHTKFPEYIKLRYHFPLSISYTYFRWFHRQSRRVLVPTASVLRQLKRLRFRNLVIWTRGVDTERFRPLSQPPAGLALDKRPVLLYVGRVAVEKNVEAFLQLKSPGVKYVVGDGPQLKHMAAKYPEVRFVGRQTGDELVAYYSCADVLVFTSRTDTYGLVILEALACGTPVAAYPVAGPVDIIQNGVTGCVDEDLEYAVKRALQSDRTACRAFALANPWRKCAEDFREFLMQGNEPRLSSRRRRLSRRVS